MNLSAPPGSFPAPGGQQRVHRLLAKPFERVAEQRLGEGFEVGDATAFEVGLQPEEACRSGDRARRIRPYSRRPPGRAE